VSPTSAYLGLAMMRLGAKGQTRKEISKGLGLPDNEENAKGFSDLIHELAVYLLIFLSGDKCGFTRANENCSRLKTLEWLSPTEFT